jgi:hypothetical protein
LGDLGGNFYTQKKYYEGVNATASISWPKNLNLRSGTFNGPCFPFNPALAPFPPEMLLSDSQIDAMGATAIARCKPTNPVANTSVFLGELYRDGLPLIPGISSWMERTKAARKAGNEYLNVQFGWRPLTSDVRSFATAAATSHSVVKQFDRDSGKVVRRAYNFPIVVQDQLMGTGSNGTFMVPFNSDTKKLTSASWEWTRRMTRRMWFSGAFTYKVPMGSDKLSTLARHASHAKKLLGISLTPETLWNLAPWSWAADWFANTGDILSNISDTVTDGLVMPYGYIMVHTIVTDTYMPTSSDLIGGMSSNVFSVVTETKQRRGANPFGFGLNWDNLSPFQLSIAGALGLSRVR